MRKYRKSDISDAGAGWYPWRCYWTPHALLQLLCSLGNGNKTPGCSYLPGHGFDVLKRQANAFMISSTAMDRYLMPWWPVSAHTLHKDELYGLVQSLPHMYVLKKPDIFHVTLALKLCALKYHTVAYNSHKSAKSGFLGKSGTETFFKPQHITLYINTDNKYWQYYIKNCWKHPVFRMDAERKYNFYAQKTN